MHDLAIVIHALTAAHCCYINSTILIRQLSLSQVMSFFGVHLLIVARCGGSDNSDFLYKIALLKDGKLGEGTKDS